MRLKDKVAIVTGGGRGIGRGIARMFTQEGAAVTIAARTVEQLESVSAEIQQEGGRVLAIPTDVSKTEDIRNMVTKTVEHFGKLDVLVNNAAISGFHRDLDEPGQEIEDLFDELMATNLRSVWMGTRYAVMEMKKQGRGSIINISSVHGVLSSPRDSAYAMSKGGMIMGTKALAVELAPFNIRVNTISPGAIVHEGWSNWPIRRFGAQLGKEFIERFADLFQGGAKMNQPLRRTGTPEDVAYCCVYLASDESLFVTGTNIMVDGGLTALLGEPRSLDLDALWERREQWKEARRWMEEHKE